MEIALIICEDHDCNKLDIGIGIKPMLHSNITLVFTPRDELFSKDIW